MKDLQIFKNEQFGEVRVLEKGNEPWFIGKDVAKILGYERTAKAILDHVEQEDKDVVPIQDSIGRMQNTAIINESGLYSLILSSKLPGAKKFKKWVTSEVLPAIRKTGMYATEELLENPDLAIQAFQKLKEERAKRKLLEEKVEEQKPKVLFAETVETSQTSILIGDLAKIIKQKGHNIGQNRLFAWLRDNDYLIKSGERKNMPTQSAMNLGLFEVKERTVNNPDGSVRITKTTKVTGKGQIYFVNKFVTQ